MAHPDQLRWDLRYSQETRDYFLRPRDLLVAYEDLLPRQGLALDAAMGLGGNASFLLRRGLRVIGADISGVAICYARQHLPDLMAVQTDLTRLWLPENSFDLIINFYFLERHLYSTFSRALKPGGILFFETLTIDMLQVHPEIEPHFLLSIGELKHAFPDLETMIYREGWVKENQKKRSVASLIAKKAKQDR